MENLGAELPLQIGMVMIVCVIIYSYIFVKLVNASRYVFSVGKLRGAIIVAGTYVIVLSLQAFPLRSYVEAFIKVQFGA